ncbi:MAG: MmgE/PrpD family protein [Peptococcaceae bacterium]|jgi:2-methylcitrate dehydratase PrpD|nr:MmgE/PrpD family protein [Peptococcaceae bacterium]
MKKYTQILADYLSGLSYEDIPPEAIERAKLVTLHTLGAAIAALRSKSAQDIIRIAKDFGQGARNATIIGEGSKVSAHNAALANGTNADLLDWEDCSWTGHPSAGAVPAGIGMAEAYHKSGKDYLTALVGAYDVYQRVAMAVQPSPQRFLQGWGLHCWQIFSPTAVAAKLLGLRGEKMNQMFGAAVHMTPVAINLIHSSFSDFYHFTHGLTAQIALECALITEKGISTLTDALEADTGYWFGVSDQCDWEWFDKDLGRRFMIMELMLKNWPVNMWIQSPMDLIHMMKEKYGFQPDDITAIEVSPFIPNRSEPSPAQGYNSLVKAQFSIPFCIAMYLKGPKVGFDWLNEKYLTDADILAMAAKVRGVGEESLISANFAAFQKGGYPTYGMRIVTRDGGEYNETLAYPKGHPRNPYNRAECAASFHLQTEAVMSREKRDALVDFVFEKLEKTADMADIGAYLKV